LSFLLLPRRPPPSPLVPYTTLFRSILRFGRGSGDGFSGSIAQIHCAISHALGSLTRGLASLPQGFLGCVLGSFRHLLQCLFRGFGTGSSQQGGVCGRGLGVVEGFSEQATCAIPSLG